MNKTVINNLLRAVVFIALQVLVFMSIKITFGSFDYIHIIVYPIVILLFPLNIPRPLIIALSFAIGLTVDVFYDSIGVHASACVFIAYIRNYVLKYLEPHGGYSIDISPSSHNLGFQWFLPYSCFMLFVFMLFYFSVEAFSFVFIFDIIMNSISSFIFSIVFILIHQFIFKTTV